uniref:Uncharacterized protein n=1 Tax=Plectus sambesii TaxID=2011161 RepID=A0A914WS13_9BILA
MVCSRTGRLWLADQQTVAEIVNSGYTDLLVNRSQLFRFDAQKSLVSALEDINRSPSPLADGDCESGIGDDDDSGKAVLAHALDYLSKRALDDVVGGAFKTPTTSSIVEVRTATVMSGNEQGGVSQHADESSDSDDNAQVDVREQLRSATAKLEEDLVAEKDRITQMKRQYKVELDAVMDEKASLEAKVTELNGKVASAQSKEKEQLKKVAALEKEVKELKERLSKVNGGGSDSAELKRQNDDLREQLRAVELSHNENDRSHRAVISRYSNRAEHAECVNQWLQQSTGTGDCPNCRKPWLSPEDFPSLH